ncbi:YciI family protein [Streptomyces sp. NRRL WC-3742]|uniref:YciI family protein n=1 Tax=Streptomyces sp. NRRL WC-3742 TaxID=1463934 RepID=UPI0004C5D7BC|nr:YciI family protein [Streptomyces sp. NRRL WC-3742]
MFILELSYTATLDRIDVELADHIAWVRSHIESGTFLVAGRKVPREGGFILAVGDDRAEIEALAATDPFLLAGLAEYRVSEFVATTTAPALDGFRQQLPA